MMKDSQSEADKCNDHEMSAGTANQRLEHPPHETRPSRHVFVREGEWQPYASAIFGWRLGSLLMCLGHPTDTYGTTANPTKSLIQ